MRRQTLIFALLLTGCLLTGCTKETAPAEEPAVTQTVQNTEAETENSHMNIELKQNDGWLEGKYFSKRFDCELDVSANLDENISEEYVQRCVDAAESLSDEQINEINEAAKRYALAFIELCRESMGDDFSFEAAELPEITKDTPASEVAEYYSLGELIADEPEEEGQLYFRFGGNCDWEIEHGFEAVFKDGELVYLGCFEMVKPSGLDYYTEGEGREWNYAIKPEA